MQASNEDLVAILLTLKLALYVSIILMSLGIPIAWFLSRLRSSIKAPLCALFALPLVLPPSVLGFYLLVAFAPQSPIGQVATTLGLGNLAFTFPGLVIASVIYSFPFVVQPIQSAMEALGKRPQEVAATLGAGPVDSFFSVVLPQIKPALLTAWVLGFAHTLGEFGVVLMVGGNIPGVTRLVSVQIYEHVEMLNYQRAHFLSAFMLLLSFLMLFIMYWINYKSGNLKAWFNTSK